MPEDPARKTAAACDADPQAFSVQQLSPVPLLVTRFVPFLRPHGRILDAWCGNGRYTKLLQEKGYRVVGIDLSVGLLRLAEFKVKGTVFLEMDMRKLGFPRASFDGIWACGSLLHVPKRDLPATLSGFFRVLKVGGRCSRQ